MILDYATGRHHIHMDRRSHYFMRVPLSLSADDHPWNLEQKGCCSPHQSEHVLYVGLDLNLDHILTPDAGPGQMGRGLCHYRIPNRLCYEGLSLSRFYHLTWSR